MADVSKGVSGYFVKDAAAHTAGESLPAVVTEVYDNTPLDDTVSIVAYEPNGLALPYGPSPISGGFTFDATEVGTVSNPAGYYFLLNDTTITAQNTADAGVSGAAASANAAANDLTPLVLVNILPGSWTYAPLIHGWHERFSGETLQIFFSASQDVTRYTVVVKDVNGVGGQVVANAYRSPRVTAPTAPSYSLMVSGLATNANGTIQSINLDLPAGNGTALHRIDVITGAANGGAEIANQYQLLQISPEV
jgi:hypothetical protein